MSFSPGLLGGDPEQAKPQGAVAVASLDGAAIRRAALVCITVPAATAPQPVRAGATGYVPYQSWTHSHTLPCISCKPQALGWRCPTGWVVPRALAAYQA